MAKAMLLIAAASASAGAAVTAILLGRRDSQLPPPAAPTTPPSSPGPSALKSPNGAFASTASVPKGIIDPSGWFSYGDPGPTNDLASRTSFISVYDRRMRNPAWVAEHITAESVSGSKGDRQNSIFLEDPTVPEIFRARLKDYFRSGYDRGHMAPAADAKFSQQAMDETFYLTNICPQVGGGFNRDYWAHLEDFCRRLTAKYPSIRVITGPLYLPKIDSDGKYRVSYEVIGSPPNIAVPTHFYKIILGESTNAPNTAATVAIGAFVLPNARIDNKTPLTDFAVPVEVIEKASGLDFLSLVPTERRRSLCREVECSIIVREFPKRPPKANGNK